MKNRDLAKNGILVFILTTIASALNYLCQLLMGRLFSIGNYGKINTIFSLILIISVVGNTAFMLMSKKLSEKTDYSIYANTIKLVNKFVIYIFVI